MRTCRLRAVSQTFSGVLLLVGLLSAQPAAADEGSCAAVRRTRALAARRGLDLGDIERLEQIECSVDYPSRGGGPPGRRGRGALDDEEFDRRVLGPIRSASQTEEVNVCRFYARATRVTSAQVSTVIRAVGQSSEAECALAFFPSVVDPLNWEVVYRPMSNDAEKVVRAAVAQAQ